VWRTCELQRQHGRTTSYPLEEGLAEILENSFFRLPALPRGVDERCVVCLHRLFLDVFSSFRFAETDQALATSVIRPNRSGHWPAHPTRRCTTPSTRPQLRADGEKGGRGEIADGAVGRTSISLAALQRAGIRRRGLYKTNRSSPTMAVTASDATR
jgi:hypothetical protein